MVSITTAVEQNCAKITTLGLQSPCMYTVPHSPRGATGTRMLTSSAREESQSSWKFNIPPLHSYILFTENEDLSITDLM